MRCPRCGTSAKGTPGTRHYRPERPHNTTPDELDLTYHEDGKVRSVRHRRCGTLLGGEGELRIDPQEK